MNFFGQKFFLKVAKSHKISSFWYHLQKFSLGIKPLNHCNDTLDSGIKVAPGKNVAPGKFGEKNKCSPICTLYLYY